MWCLLHVDVSQSADAKLTELLGTDLKSSVHARKPTNLNKLYQFS